MDTYRSNSSENTGLLYPLSLPCFCRPLGSKIPNTSERLSIFPVVQIALEDSVSAVAKE